MSGVVRFAEAGLQVECRPEAEGALRLHVLPDPVAALKTGQPIKRNAYRAAARVEVAGLGPVLLKVHRPHGIPDVLRAAVRPSRARTEWRAALYLRGVGVPTPQPLFAASRRHGPFLALATSASRFLSVRETFEPALLAQPRAMARALLVRATRLVRAFHDRGVSHGDLHSGNVLVGPGPGDRCELHVVDLHTVRTGRPIRRRTRDRQLAQWLHSLAASVGPGGRLRALVAYLGGAPSPQEKAEAWGRLVRRIRAREKRRLRSRGRRCHEENDEFTADVGEGRGWRRKSFSVEALGGALAGHDRALAAGGPAVLKDGHKSRVTRLGADLVPGGALVKESLAYSALRRLEDFVLPSRRRGGYDHAHALRLRGFGTALPLAFVRRGGRTFTLYEDLSAFPRLDHRVRAAWASRDFDRRRRRRVIEASADVASRLHRRGVWHGDLKAPNWLVDERGPAWSFRIVDTDRVRFLPRISRSRRLRNLAQLAASIPRVVTKTDRLRWWRRYARGTALEGKEATRDAARDLAVLLSKKTVVVDEPIE